MDEGEDAANYVQDDVWFHIVNLIGVAAKDILEDMSNELPVDVDGIWQCCLVLSKIGHCRCHQRVLTESKE